MGKTDMALSRRAVLTTGIGGGACLLVSPYAFAAVGPIRQAIAITQVFGEGQKLVAVALDYATPIASAGLSPAAFRVDGRTVTQVYAATAAEPAARARSGRYVIVALSPDDAGASLRVQQQRRGPGPGGPGGPGAGGPPQGPALGSRGPSGALFRPAEATVTQVAAIRTASGRSLPAGGPVATTAVRNLVVDDFRQFTFRDPATGDTLRYNLFMPKGYDPKKRYPLVLFMHDAGVTNEDPLATLKQGLGAVVWASPEEQAKHPCFVLAPQYDTVIVNDDSQASSALDTTVHLVEQVARSYAVDRDRIYTTGQSGGAMMSIAIDIKYPDLFAASLIVAGQWDPALVKPLANDKLWIIVSEGDLKAYPGQNAITARLEQEGAKVSRATWSGTSSPAEFAADVAAMQAKNTPINYVALRKGTVVPAGQDDNGGSNHVNTWRIAYTIEGVRDWLFRQHR